MSSKDSAPLPKIDPRHDPSESKNLGLREAREVWSAVARELESILRREQLQTWFLRVGATAFDGEALSLAVPSNFHRSWILENYQDALAAASTRALGFALRIQISVDPERAGLAAAEAAATADGADVRVAAPVVPAPPRPARLDAPRAPSLSAAAPMAQASFFEPQAAPNSGESDDAMLGPLSLGSGYSFDNFVVGPCNRFAYAGAKGVADNPSKAYNPLFLHGSVGLGKTHLLQAVCREILRVKPATRILFLSCESFTNHFIAALEKGALENFRRRYRNVDVLVVDDIHFLANKERTQEEFFHTFNALFQSGRQIVLSSDSPAKDIPTLQDRLVSRFKWGLEAEIEKPCFETRLAILKRKARAMNTALADDVALFLAERVTSNIRELEGAIHRIVGYSSLQNEPISLALVRRVMPELETDKSAVVRLEDISAVVAKRYHVRLQDLQSRRRHQSVAVPRQMAMFLARKHTKHSLEEIGGYFGGRDHTTVLYAIEKIETLLTTDSAVREAASLLSEEIARTFARPTPA